MVDSSDISSRILLKPAATYAGIVFGVGCGLGAIRVLFIAPRLGARIAELVEMPLMLGASVLAARWILGHFSARITRASSASALGVIALAMLLGAEAVLGMSTQRTLSLKVLLNPDPVSGTAYYVSLTLF